MKHIEQHITISEHIETYKNIENIETYRKISNWNKSPKIKCWSQDWTHYPKMVIEPWMPHACFKTLIKLHAWWTAAMNIAFRVLYMYLHLQSEAEIRKLGLSSVCESAVRNASIHCAQRPRPF